MQRGDNSVKALIYKNRICKSAPKTTWLLR